MQQETRSTGWPITAGWILLGAVVAALFSLAVVLVIKMDLISPEPLDDEETRSVWAFLGVALGAAATVIAALLTEQNHRRAAALAREAAAREDLARQQQRDQDQQTARRLELDTRARVLELLSHEQHYAPPARVAGAIATMMDLRDAGGGAIACRLLAELWGDAKVGTSSAVWLLERVLLGGDEFTAGDKIAAADALGLNASKLFPIRSDPDQNWTQWPSFLDDGWPTYLPTDARGGLIYMALIALLAREPEFWMSRGKGGIPPVDALYQATIDDDLGDVAALALVKILSVPDFLPFGDVMTADEEARVRALAEHANVIKWASTLIDRFERWSTEGVADPDTSPQHPPLADSHLRTREPTP